MIAVDPGDANRVWVGGIDLFRSDDAGVNWGLASYWWMIKVICGTRTQIITSSIPSGLQRREQQTDVRGHGRRRLSTDDARAPVATAPKAACNPDASGVAWTSLNNGYGVTQFYHGAVFPDGKSYFGGTQDNGTLLGGDDNGVNAWEEVFGETAVTSR